MEPSTRKSLIKLLQKCQGIFAFSPKEMPGIDPKRMEHQLNIDPTHKPMIQKNWHMGSERAATVTREV